MNNTFKGIRGTKFRKLALIHPQKRSVILKDKSRHSVETTELHFESCDIFMSVIFTLHASATLRKSESVRAPKTYNRFLAAEHFWSYQWCILQYRWSSRETGCCRGSIK